MNLEHLQPDEIACLNAALAFVSPAGTLTDDLIDHLAARNLLESLDAEENDPQERPELRGELCDLLATADELWSTYDDNYVGRIDLRIVGACFTHRVSAEELEAGLVALSPDLVALIHGRDMREPLQLAHHGGTLRVTYADADDATGDLVGPEGWLAAYAPGDVLVFSRQSEHRVAVDVVRDERELTPGEREADALHDRFGHTDANAGVMIEIDDLVLDVLIVDAECFATPTLPIGELLAMSQLECRAGFVGEPGTPWFRDLPDPGDERGHIAYEFAFEGCCREAFDTAVDALDAFDGPEAERIDWGAVGEALLHSEVARALVAYADDQDAIATEAAIEGGTVRLAEFAVSLRERSETPEGRENPLRAGGAFIMSLLVEQAGDPASARALVGDAIASSPGFPAAVDEFAWMLAEEGELEQAIRVRQRLAFERDDELSYLVSLRPTERRASSAGRNDPCPCGSGKKYKACCLNKPIELTARQHAGWLQHKLARFATHRRFRAAAENLAALALANQVDRAAATNIENELYDNGLLVSWLLFGEGVIQAYFDERAAMLPAIEQAMLADWVQRRMTLWEIVNVVDGERVTVRDLVDQHELDVFDEASSAEFHGQLLLGVLGRVGDKIEFIDLPLRVDPENQARTLELASLDELRGADIAQWFAELARPV